MDHGLAPWVRVCRGRQRRSSGSGSTLSHYAYSRVREVQAMFEAGSLIGPQTKLTTSIQALEVVREVLSRARS